MVWQHAQQHGLELDPVVDCSRLRRAWETADGMARVLEGLGSSKLAVREFDALPEVAAGAVRRAWRCLSARRERARLLSPADVQRLTMQHGTPILFEFHAGRDGDGSNERWLRVAGDWRERGVGAPLD